MYAFAYEQVAVAAKLNSKIFLFKYFEVVQGNIIQNMYIFYDVDMIY